MRRGMALAEAGKEWKRGGESKRFMSFWMAAAIFIGSSPQRPMRIAKHQKRGMFLSILKDRKKTEIAVSDEWLDDPRRHHLIEQLIRLAVDNFSPLSPQETHSTLFSSRLFA